MIEDMRLRNFATGTVDVYVNCVARLARHFGKSPEPGSEHHEDLLMDRRKVVNGLSFW
jgi:hypothetical protein